MKMRPHPAAHSHNLSLDRTDSFFHQLFGYQLLWCGLTVSITLKIKNKKITLVYVSRLEE